MTMKLNNKWIPSKCITTFHPAYQIEGEPLCEGHMELVDVEIKAGRVEHGSDDGQLYHIVTNPMLTKIWACDKCGEIFKE